MFVFPIRLKLPILLELFNLISKRDQLNFNREQRRPNQVYRKQQRPTVSKKYLTASKKDLPIKAAYQGAKNPRNKTHKHFQTPLAGHSSHVQIPVI